MPVTTRAQARHQASQEYLREQRATPCFVKYDVLGDAGGLAAAMKGEPVPPGFFGLAIEPMGHYNPCIVLSRFTPTKGNYICPFGCLCPDGSPEIHEVDVDLAGAKYCGKNMSFVCKVRACEQGRRRFQLRNARTVEVALFATIQTDYDA